jgi:MoxR-like ATPase
MAALVQSANLQDVFKAVVQARKLKLTMRNILLAGPPGVGKTTFPFLLADLLKMLAYKVQHHAEGSPPEIFGMYVPKEKSFDWMPGPLDLAYQNGGMLIHDEINEASGPMKIFLHGALDNGRGGEISYIGRTFKPERGMMNVATMNGWPYDGSLDPALLDRFDATFIITKPSAKQIALLDKDLQSVCEDSYDKPEDPMIGPAVTFRMLMSFQALRAVLPLEQAALSACHGHLKLATGFLEALAMGGDEDDDLLDDDEDDDDDDE